MKFQGCLKKTNGNKFGELLYFQQQNNWSRILPESNYKLRERENKKIKVRYDITHDSRFNINL